jgi:serine protease AprX
LFKRMGQWAPNGEQPWTDENGHGTMCACIAAGTTQASGEFNGVAPGAGLIACKTKFYDSELASIYDYLADLAGQGKIIIATNSFGKRTGTAPSVPADSDFIPALEGAIAAGVKVYFSAGNYHLLAGGNPTSCAPTSIWLHKCRADVMTIANCQMDGVLWPESSRGPGQHFGDPGMRRKPDVVAPTPEYGRVLYGDKIRNVRWWGTSGACPQAAGLAALLLARRPDLGCSQLFDAIRQTAIPLNDGLDCVGAGLIDCRAAFDAL